MGGKTVFLLQNSSEGNQELKKKFNEETDFNVVGEETDGILAFAKIAEIKPNFIITDIILSGIDGLSLIKKVKELRLDSKIIVLTSLRSEDIIKKAEQYGADYFMIKPCNFETLKERMSEFEQCITPYNSRNILLKVSLEQKISEILLSIGVPAKIKGYTYLREAIKLVIDEPSLINRITIKLYPSIAEKFNTSSSKVERAIRHAIAAMWAKNKKDKIDLVLGVHTFDSDKRPTNGEFIAMIADKVILEENYNNLQKNIY